MILTIERLAQVQKKNSEAALINPFYLNEDKNSQRYRSLRGQRTVFIEFHEFMFNMSDIELQQLIKKHKKWVTENYSETERYVDSAIVRASIDYQIALRESEAIEIELLEEIAKDFRYEQQLSKDFPEIDSAHLINFIKKLQ